MPVAVNEQAQAAALALVRPQEHTLEQVAAAEALLPVLVKIRGKCECDDDHWHWRGHFNRHGTAMVRVGRTVRKVLSVAWEEAHGRPIPPDRTGGNLCGYEDCVSPLCATATTMAAVLRRAMANVNHEDRFRKIAMAMRSKCGAPEEVVQAVRAADLPARDRAAREALATQYGVSVSAINQWRSRRLRKDFTDPMGSIVAGLMGK